MKTIAQQLNIKEFPFIIKDNNGNELYFEDSYGYWVKRRFDGIGNTIYFENSDGYWYKKRHDKKGIQIYFKNSNGKVIDRRPEYTMAQLVEKLGEDFKLIK